MAFKSFRNGYNRFRNRTRVIVHKVRSRTRLPRRSFVKKHKTLIILALLGGALFVFKDKISTLLAKK